MSRAETLVSVRDRLNRRESSSEELVPWQNRRLYYECSFCHYAHTVPLSQGSRGEKKDCETCGAIGTFGPARHWLRPPGFAHPVFKEEGTSPDDQPAHSYATRAKLTAPTPVDEEKWWRLNPRIRAHYARQHLLVTNRGPREEGYTYCTKCGLIEPMYWFSVKMTARLDSPSALTPSASFPASSCSLHFTLPFQML